MNYVTLTTVLAFPLPTQAAAPARRPQNRQRRQYTIEQFDTTSISGDLPDSISDDGKWMFLDRYVKGTPGTR